MYLDKRLAAIEKLLTACVGRDRFDMHFYLMPDKTRMKNLIKFSISDFCGAAVSCKYVNGAHDMSSLEATSQAIIF